MTPDRLTIPAIFAENDFNFWAYSMSMPLSPPTITLKSLIDAELKLTLDAPQRLGSIVDIAQRGLAILSTAIVRVNEHQGLIAAFMFSIQKHMTLAFLSYVRSHTAQADLNCRQAIELTALGAYLLANQDAALLDETDPDNPKLKNSQCLSKKAYKWLDKAEPELSGLLNDFKKSINESTAHGSLYVTHLAVDLNSLTDDGERFTGSFFDNVSINDVRTYLIQFCKLMVLIVETMWRANEKPQGIVFKESLRAELEIYAHAIDCYRIALGKVMHHERQQVDPNPV